MGLCRVLQSRGKMSACNYCIDKEPAGLAAGPTTTAAAAAVHHPIAAADGVIGIAFE